MVKKGDKYIIEIGDVFYDTYMKTYYKIKGFNALIFDDYGIEKLEKPKPNIMPISSGFSNCTPWEAACLLINATRNEGGFCVRQFDDADLKMIAEYIEGYLSVTGDVK